MIRTVAWGASREELVADLARIEALEADESWRGVTALAKHDLRARIAHLDRSGRRAELRRENVALSSSIVV